MSPLSFASIRLAFIAFVLALVYRPASTHKDAILSGDHPRVLLVTAHPDDECLFFGPTILSLQASASTGSSNSDSSLPEIYSLCLSIGDADGLGSTRSTELARSLDILGVDADHRRVLDHPLLKDNFTLSWDMDVIADAVRPYVENHGITTILTFDYEGISGHPNHKSLPRGMKLLATRLADSTTTTASEKSPRIFALITVPLVTKYIGPFAAVLAKVDFQIAGSLNSLTVGLLQALRSVGFNIPAPPTDPSAASQHRMAVFTSGIAEYTQALRAMRAHSSQLVWFRWLNVGFSRYMWVNEWVEI